MFSGVHHHWRRLAVLGAVHFTVFKGTPAKDKHQENAGQEAASAQFGQTTKDYSHFKPLQEPKKFSTIECKVFNDSVHGNMTFHPLCQAIIDTPEFQRLRFLKQLGVAYFVYPGAAHNRFEHSLGVCHLAGQLVKTLQRAQPELKISKEDVLCVEIAGLCHDLGHGPFSHMFDNKFIPKMRPDRGWKHEKASVAIFDHLVEKNHLEAVFQKYGIDKDRREFIKQLIWGKGRLDNDQEWFYPAGSKKEFLYEIVANKRNEVDVDKWDYFKRDSMQLGMTTSFDHSRFINFCRVIEVDGEWQICVRDKEAFNVYEMFHTRHALHRRAYQHKAVQAVEIMLLEAMKEADDHIRIPISGDNGKGKGVKLSECVDHMDAYLQLTDALFQDIQRSTDPRLKKSRDMLLNIQKRKLHKLVVETEPVTDDDVIKKSGDEIKQEILKEIPRKPVAELELDTYIFAVQILSLDYGMKGKNPVDYLRFYTKENPNRATGVAASEISRLLPQQMFRERIVRLFVLPDEDKKVSEKRDQAVLQGFQRWCRKNGNLKYKKPGQVMEEA